MSQPVNVIETIPGSKTSFEVDIGVASLLENDLIYILLSWRVSGTLAISGFTAIGTKQNTDAYDSQWFVKKAAASESNPTASTTGAAASASAVVVVMRGADSSGTALDSVNAHGNRGGTTGTTLTSADLTTTVDDCIILHGVTWDQTGVIAPLADMTRLGTGSGCVGMTYKATAGAIPTFTFTGSNGSNAGRAWAIAIKNASGGDKPVRMTDGREYLQKLGGFATLTAGLPDSVTGLTQMAGIIMHTAANLSGGFGTFTLGVGTTLGAPWATNGSSFSSNQRCAATAWVGTFLAVSSVSVSGKIITIPWGVGTTGDSGRVGPNGFVITLVDSVNNWATYQVLAQKDWYASRSGVLVIKPGTTALFASSETEAGSSGVACDFDDLVNIGYFYQRAALPTSDAAASWICHPPIIENDVCAFVGGGVGIAVSTDIEARYLRGGTQLIQGTPLHVSFQGSGQLVNRVGLQLGDGSTATYSRHTAQSYDIPATDETTWRVGTGGASVIIKASASDTHDLRSAIFTASTLQPFTIDAASSLSASLLTTGLSIIGRTFSDLAGYDWTSASWTECDTVAFKDGNLTTCTIASPNATIDGTTGAVCSFSASGATVSGTTINCTKASGSVTGYHLELGTAVTAITLTDVTFTGTPATDKVHVLATTGTVTITISGTTSLAAGDVTSAGATVVISAPTYHRGLNFTGLVNGSKVKVFSPGTQTVLFGTDSVTGNAFAFDDSTSGSTTVDYTIQKVGYLPIRATGVALNGSTVEATGRPDTAITQVLDRAYSASSGLTYGSTAVVTVGSNPTTNPGTKTFQLGAASTGQNWYSFWIEQWIDKGDDGEALANVEFPLAANGPNSFTLRNGWTFSDGATSIDYLTRDGLRYTNTNGATTASWCAILTSGAGNKQVRYQQSDGGTTEDGAMVNNEMDQLVQIISDPNGNGDYTDGFNRSGYLVLKVQAEGYDQAEANAVTLYGTLEDQLYVVGLAPTANGIATGDPALTITLERGTFNDLTSGKTFGVKIVSSASGTDIMRELRYNFGAGGEYPAASGYDGFDWHDLVQTNGSDFKTVLGNLYGSAASKGVVVYSAGTTLHPDFTLFTADDGTTYSPPVTADISITSMPNDAAGTTRLQIFNSTALSASAWAANTVYATGALVKRSTGIGSENTAGLYFRATTGGTSHATTEPTWDTTAGNTTADGTVVWTCYNVLYYDADPAATSLTDTYIDGEEFLDGEVAGVRFAEMNGSTSFKTYDTEVSITAAGFSALVAEEADAVFATFAIDGSTLDATFSPNFTSDYIVLDSNTDFSGKGAFAYYCYTLTTSQGMYEFWGGVTALDEGNIRINTSVLNLYFDESAGFVKQTDDIRIFRSDGTRPALDPTTGGSGVEINWRTPVSTIETGVSGVTAQDITDIATAAALAVVSDGKTLTVPKFLGLK